MAEQFGCVLLFFFLSVCCCYCKSQTQHTDRFWAFAQCAAPKRVKASERLWILLKLTLYIWRPAHRTVWMLYQHSTLCSTLLYSIFKANRKANCFFFSLSMFVLLLLPLVWFFCCCSCVWFVFTMMLSFVSGYYDTWRRECENREKAKEMCVQCLSMILFFICLPVLRCGCVIVCIVWSIHNCRWCDTPTVYHPHGLIYLLTVHTQCHCAPFLCTYVHTLTLTLSLAHTRSVSAFNLINVRFSSVNPFAFCCT